MIVPRKAFARPAKTGVIFPEGYKGTLRDGKLALPLFDGSVRGEDIRFAVRGAEYRGHVRGGTIEGTVVSGGITRAWSARRKD